MFFVVRKIFLLSDKFIQNDVVLFCEMKFVLKLEKIFEWQIFGEKLEEKN